LLVYFIYRKYFSNIISILKIYKFHSTLVEKKISH
jgi:hypothetical protein